MSKNKSSEPRTSGARSHQVEAIVAQLRAMGTEESRAGMARFAIRTEQAFGVSVYDLRKVAKTIGTDHELAIALWATANHEARLLACFVDDPSAVSAEQMDAWVREFDSWDICDQATTSLFDLTGHAWDKAVEWAVREEEWVKRGGFALMAGLAVHDKTADDASFVSLLALVRQEARDDRNFVKKAVNWALRNIGKRNLVLNAAAIECAEGILEAANRAAGAPRGGDAGIRAARWIATDALRELRSEAVQARLRKRGKAGG
ncbi:MAG TPA: DNA alkylation repair protein [Polyangiaceae bacterium]|nr:DNA alkylation repair protein [Polyangiaceae bacterium]